MNYVMFGHNSLLGEIVDIINIQGNVLSKIVQNIPEQPISGRKTLAEQISMLPFKQKGQKGTKVNSNPILIESFEDFEPKPDERYILGFTGPKQEGLVRHLKKTFNISFKSLVHPSVVISPTAHIGEGALILASSVISSNVVIGNHVFINKASIIGHDAQVSDFATIQPGVKLSGYVTVEKGATLCVGSVVIENLTVGSGSMVAAGAVVTSNVMSDCMVAGVPARLKKSRKTQ